MQVTVIFRLRAISTRFLACLLCVLLWALGINRRAVMPQLRRVLRLYGEDVDLLGARGPWASGCIPMVSEQARSEDSIQQPC